VWEQNNRCTFRSRLAVKSVDIAYLDPTVLDASIHNYFLVLFSSSNIRAT
jgi:hypothetical protein